MKLTDIHSDWIGLARLDQYPYQIDYYSTPDNWQIGFEIVYRLMFSGDESKLSDTRVVEDIHNTFKGPFELPDNHFYVGPLETDYWRIYWDKQGFDLRLLCQCEQGLDDIAIKYGIKVTLIEMTIVPRSLRYLSQYIT